MNRMKQIVMRLTAGGMVVLLLLLCCSCRQKAVNTESGAARIEYPLQIGDVVLSESPSHVAVYSSSLADVVCALGNAYILKLVARGSDCAQPDVAVLPTAGSAAEPDIEALQKLGVTLILTEEALAEDKLAELKQAGIQTLTFAKAVDRAEIVTLYCNVASALAGGKTGYEAGEKRARGLLSSMDDVERVIPDGDTVQVAGYILNETGDFATDSTFTGKLLSFIGVSNLAGDNATLTKAELETADPSVLFCATGLRETIMSEEKYAGLSAVQNGQVYEIDPGLMEWQGDSMLDGVIAMASALYPALMGSSSPSTSSGTASAGTKIPASVDENSSYQDILTMQNRLIELGYMQAPGDGTYGYWTIATVKEFQHRVGLEQTGIANEATMQALFSAEAPKA